MFLKSSRYYTLKSTFDLMTMYAYSFFLNQCFKNQGHLKKIIMLTPLFQVVQTT